MLVNVYSVRDNLVGVYLAPFIEESDAKTIRDFGDAVVKSDSQISKHPEDFSLVKLATFDRESGKFVSCDPAVLAHASDFIKKGAK